MVPDVERFARLVRVRLTERDALIELFEALPELPLSRCELFQPSDLPSPSVSSSLTMLTDLCK